MKKSLIITVALFLVILLPACGSRSSNTIIQPNEAASQEKQADNKIFETPVQNIKEKNDIQEAKTKFDQAQIDETILFDEADIKITAKSLVVDALFGTELKLLIENNTDKNLTFQCRNASVNGYMIDTIMSSDVASGKKANDTLTFMSSDLDICGIKSIADMEFSFHIFTSGDWDNYLDTPQIQLKTHAADSYNYIFDDSGNTVYDDSGVKIVIKGLTEDSSFMGPSVVVYISNESDKNITIQARDVSVNGFMVDPIFSTDVMIGKHAISTITFTSSELEENDITSIDEIELSFHVFEMDSWDNIFDTESIAIEF